MAVVRADLKAYRSVVWNDTAANGGRQSSVEAVGGTIGNMFPDAGVAERAAGSTKYRKVFYANRNVAGDVLTDSKLFIENYTPADDEAFLILGTPVDLQSGIAGNRYGSGQLNLNVGIGISTLEVAVHDGAVSLFRNGELLRISDKTNLDDSLNNAEYIRIHASTAVTVLADIVTIPLETPTTFAFTAAQTRVASVIESGTLGPSIASFLVTSGSGTYDDSGSPVEFDNQGTVFQSWTLVFTDALTYTATGDSVGLLATTGSTGADYAPSNPATATPYFTLRAAGFGGTFAIGDQITFTTASGSVPVWHERVIPAGATSLSGNSFFAAIDGVAA